MTATIIPFRSRRPQQLRPPVNLFKCPLVLCALMPALVLGFAMVTLEPDHGDDS